SQTQIQNLTMAMVLFAANTKSKKWPWHCCSPSPHPTLDYGIGAANQKTETCCSQAQIKNLTMALLQPKKRGSKS
ncbi:MAG: hypothetical protein ACKPKO_37355, partial [Candidatus Fonsibacter sp.]